MLSVVAVLLHLAALGGVQWGWPASPAAPAAPEPAAPMWVRVVEVEAADAATSPPVAPPPDHAERAAPRTSGLTLAAQSAPQRDGPARVRVAATRAPAAETRAMAAARPAAALEAALAAAPVREPVAEAVSRTDRETAARGAAEPVLEPALEPALEPVAAAPLRRALGPAEAPPASGAEPIPVYRTRLPPATTLRYEMSRGALTGRGELAWRPEGDRYALSLKGSVGGLPVITQISTGAFDAGGVAPERFTDQRLRRGTVAANFQRGIGKATFSGPSTEVVLQPGAQDRLSWMVQLGAIVAADPQFRTPGAKVVMQVIGAHGEAGVWSFRCIGPEAVASRGGPIEAIKFVREPREPYDTTVQVWLDPLHHDLPVRATQKSGPSDEGFELRLLEVVTPN